MTAQQYLTALCAFEYFGPARVSLLVKYFGSAKLAWESDANNLLKIGLQNSRVKQFIKFRNEFDVPNYFEKLDKYSVRVITILDTDYPENLKNLTDAPPVLYVRGELKKADANAVGIIGTRMMTAYGKEVSTRFASELVSYGITIVSGLALGVDAQAQKSALSAGGRTIAVLASGLDIITPQTNKELALQLIRNHGALVSEYPLGHFPQKHDFVVRNRLISGLSKAIVVVESRMKSGTFHTVTAALNQGRSIFSVPGPITSPASEGTNFLIQNGAKLTTNTKDIIDDLGMQIRVDREIMEKTMPGGKYEQNIILLLEQEPLHLDEIVRISGAKTAEVSARLTIMEMKGLVRNVGSGVYRKI